MTSARWLDIINTPNGHALREFDGAFFATKLSGCTTPSFVSMIGGRAKSAIIRELTEHDNRHSADASSTITLRTDFKNRDPALLFLDFDIPSIFTNHVETSDEIIHPFPWSTGAVPSPKCIGIHVTANLLSPLSDVICFFAADLNGLKGVSQLLAEQAVRPVPHDSPQSCLPRALVVLDTNSNIFDSSIVELRMISLVTASMESLKPYDGVDGAIHDLWSHFQTIRVLGLGKRWKKDIRCCAMRNRICSMAEEARQSRRVAGYLFNYCHQTSFASCLLKSFPVDDKQFSFVDASRPKGFDSKNLLGHVAEVLKKMPSQNYLWHFVVPLVASCSVLASYPAQSHCMFAHEFLLSSVANPKADFLPSTLFTRLYEKAFHAAICDYTISSDVQKKFIVDIENAFLELYKRLASKSPTVLHLAQLKTLKPMFARFKSHSTCFCCLMRMPEKVFSCGHSVCDICIQTFGTPSKNQKYVFELPRCLFCGTALERTEFQYIPPTAGIRLLSIDGGGIRGVISLIHLSHFENLLSKFHCSVRDTFDLAVGTSAGGLIVLGLFLMRWTPADCLDNFEKLAFDTFQHQDSRVTSFSGLQRLLSSWINDRRYESTAIERLFQTEDELRLQMFNPLNNETKVAVTTTTAKDSMPCLVTNYNGQQRGKNNGKHFQNQFATYLTEM